MSILEKNDTINNAVKQIVEFIQTSPVVKDDFNEYLKTIGANNGANLQGAIFTYIFERRLGENFESIPELFVENSKLDKETKEIANSINKAVSSIFEIKRVTKSGFELYNIVNEKNYFVTSLMKMTNFRGLGVGDYVVARVVNIHNDYYLMEISGVLSSTKKTQAYRFAVAKIIQNPELVYIDNPEKQKEIEKDVEDVYKKFIEYFGKDEVITTNKCADELIGKFNDYTENGTKDDYSDLIKEPDEYKFFAVSEFNNSYDNFLENSLGGFSSHKETYDVGIIYDKELGMYAVPFYGTFNKIFEVEDYTKIENYESCIKFFLENDKYSANLIKSVASKYPKFMDIVNSVLAKNYSLDELLNKYKKRYINNKIISSTTVLYRSSAFSNTLGIIEEDENKPQIDTTKKIGRNDLCPCGSGKKYKKCCGRG